MKRMGFIMVLGMCVFGIFPNGAEADFSTTPESLSVACDTLAERLTVNISKGRSVAVRPFSSTGGVRTLLSVRLQDLLTNGLSRAAHGKFQVVERLRMAELDLERVTHGSGGATDLDRWAQRLRADLIVAGTYAVAGKHLELDCRLLAPETGRTPGAARLAIPFSDDIKRLARIPAASGTVAGVFEAISAPSESGAHKGYVRLFRVMDGKRVAFAKGKAPAFRVGEYMGFSVRPPMTSRLYVFNYDPQGTEASVIFIYPLPQMPASVFRKDQSVVFPTCVDPRAVSYPVDPPTGRMVFKIIGVAADAPNVDLVSGLNGGAGYFELRRKDLGPLLHTLLVLPPSAWWEESVDFWILE